MYNNLTIRSFSGLFRTALFAALFLFAGASSLKAQFVYALSSDNLIIFNAAAPEVVLSTTAITGVSAAYDIVGMDFRPATGELYILGYSQDSGGARLYTLDVETAIATAIGSAPIVLEPGMGKIGFDFNPTVDRIRVTGSNNANYRLHPVTGAIAATDMDLAFAATDANSGANPSIGAVAYTNSYIGATGTTLYNLDDSLGILTTQIPPNNGTLNTVGSLGLFLGQLDESTDMDIYFDPLTGMNTAYVVGTNDFGLADFLYTLHLTTGVATLVGPIGFDLQIDDISVFIDRELPEEVSGKLVYALAANNNLLSFDSEAPTLIRSQVAVSGIAAGQMLVGLDFRPATGELYALGYNNGTGEARLYVIAPATGVATAVGSAAVTLASGMGKIGFDFNPTVDRIRVTGSNNANYRLHPVTGAIAATDMGLAFAAGDVNAAVNPSIGAVAYTNSYIGASSTVLYNYDDSLNVLTTQIPPNNGTLNTIGTSGLMLNLGDASADIDIAYDTATQSNVAYLAANTGLLANDNFYTINLSTGATTLVGMIGFGIAVNDIAVLIEVDSLQDVTGQLVYALTSNNNLISFDSDSPENVRSQVAVSGIAAGQMLVGMDFRPATGGLIGLGYNSMNGEARLYTINEVSGVATPIGDAAITLALGSGDIGFDFNPTVDRIRVVGANGANYRLHPGTGALAATDINLAFAAGDVNTGISPSIGAVAYTNSFNGTTGTTLYNYDNLLGILTTQIPPNNGTLNTVGSVGFVLSNPADPSVDFDIYYDFESGMNVAYLAANPVGSNDNFYSLDLATGSASLIGQIGNGIAVRDIAVGIDSVLIVGTDDPTLLSAPLAVSPNPASQQTRFSFELPEAAQVRLEVSDISGRQVAVVLDAKLPAGPQQLEWITANQNAGMYFVRIYVNQSLQATTKVLVQHER